MEVGELQLYQFKLKRKAVIIVLTDKKSELLF